MQYTTDIQEATQLLETLQRLDAAIASVQTEMIGQGLSEDDAMPDRNGEPTAMTYGGRILQLEAQKARIEAAREDKMDLVKQLRELQIKNEFKGIQQAIEA